MSLEALLIAARDRLRRRLGLDPAACEVTFDGRPFPHAGELFVAVHEGEWRADESVGAADLSLPEAFGVEVTVTVRCGAAPFDRIGTEVLAAARRGLLAVCRQAAVALHMSYEVIEAANAELGTGANGLYHPLVFRDGGRATPRGPDWFGARGTKANPPCGLSRTLAFGGAQRAQRLESMT